MKRPVNLLRRRMAVTAGSAALVISGAGIVSAQPAHACSGVGYHLDNDNMRNRPSLTITFGSQATKDKTTHQLQEAIGEIQRQTRTRIVIGGISEKKTPTSIVVRTSYSNETCFGRAFNSWNGCGGYDAPNNVVSNGWININPRAYSRGHNYQHALLAHELGHALGLRHTSTTSSLMHENVSDNDYTGVAYKSGDIKGLRYLAR